jgi:hypothetical protein
MWQGRVPIPAEDFREMRGESDEATAPEMQGFFIARVFLREVEMGEDAHKGPRPSTSPPASLRTGMRESAAIENDVDEDE